MAAKARCNRPTPLPSLSSEQGIGKIIAKCSRNIGARRPAQRNWQRNGLPKALGGSTLIQSGDDFCGLPLFRRADKNLFKPGPRVAGIARRIAIKPTAQVRIRRGYTFHLSGSQKLHLGPQPPPDDSIILIQPHTQGFPIINFFFDIVPDELINFRRIGRALPCLFKLARQPSHPALINCDCPIGRVNRDTPPTCKGKDQ